ncbi:MAG: ribonuclease P protein component [Candidatus Andersenbacteria bacterium]
MLAAGNRLRRTRDIERVRGAGRSVGSKLLHIRFTSNHRSTSRATVVVSTRTAKRATVRNRIKRQVRAVLAPLLPRLSPPRDLMVIVHAAALQVSFTELRATLHGMLKRV